MEFPNSYKIEQSILWVQWVDLNEYVSKFYLRIETLTHGQICFRTV